MSLLERFENLMKRFLGPAQLNTRKQRVVRAPRVSEADLNTQGFERHVATDGRVYVIPVSRR